MLQQNTIGKGHLMMAEGKGSINVSAAYISFSSFLHYLPWSLSQLPTGEGRDIPRWVVFWGFGTLLNGNYIQLASNLQSDMGHILLLQ